MSGFLDMGGYAAYVWPSYAISAVVLIGVLVASIRTMKARHDALAAFEEQEGKAADDVD